MIIHAYAKKVLFWCFHFYHYKIGNVNMQCDVTIMMFACLCQAESHKNSTKELMLSF